MPYSGRPPLLRDCLECGAHNGMELQNTARTQPLNIPLLYLCSACGCTLTIPPPQSPITPPTRKNEE